MKTIRLIDESVGPGGARLVPALGMMRCELGVDVEVPDEIAGEPPSDEGPGSGLLAQYDVWIDPTAPLPGEEG